MKIEVEIPDFGLSIKINYKGGKKPWLYIYVKHPTNICYWSIILINVQTLATVVIIFCTCQVLNSANAYVTM